MSFVRSIAVLDFPADDQTRWLDSLGLPGGAGVADELALEFDDGFQLLPQFVEHGWIPTHAAEKMREFDKLLSAMSGPGKPEIWEVSALGTAEAWADVRKKASAILFEL